MYLYFPTVLGDPCKRLFHLQGVITHRLRTIALEHILRAVYSGKSLPFREEGLERSGTLRKGKARTMIYLATVSASVQIKSCSSICITDK